MNIEPEHLDIYRQLVNQLNSGFPGHPYTPSILQTDALLDVLETTALRLHDNFPYHHPFYMGQMLKPPHPVAQLAYMLALNINPNNHALDGGRASSKMEKEAVENIAHMFGWQSFLGHLCGGGTMANFEALWIARELAEEKPKPVIVASEQSHYTHARLSQVLGLDYRAIATDHVGAMDIDALESVLQQDQVSTVVATLGSTLAGAIDPLHDIVKLQQRYEFRIHVDTAYGGYFTLVNNLDPVVRRAFDAIAQADSIVVDPHKHGLQPYGCGCVLFKDPMVGQFYQHDSPYTYFSSQDLHLGEISLECSRPGAAAVALWATQQAFPLSREGQFSWGLERCRAAALTLYQWLHESAHMTPLFGPQLDIVCWAPTAKTASATSELSRQFFDVAATFGLHLAIARIPKKMCVALQHIEQWDEDGVDCLRACMMKPEHEEYMPKIQALLDKTATAIF